VIADIPTDSEPDGLRIPAEPALQLKPLPMTAPVAITMIFISGFVAIPAFGKWASQVTEGLAFLLATVLLVLAIMYLCDRWPEYFANPRAPVAVTVTPFDE
jgi:K+-transporting ATPase A subunit